MKTFKTSFCAKDKFGGIEIKPKKWNPFEITWISFFLIIAVFIKFYFNKSFLDLSASVSGAFCVILTSRGSMFNFPFGIYSSIAYGYLSFKNHLYAEAFSCLFLSVPAIIISFFTWKNHYQDSSVEMKKLTTKKIIILVLTSLLIVFVVGAGLSKIKGQNNPFLDSSTVIMSNEARILKIMRFREQWIVYSMLNIATVIKWVLRLRAGSKEAAMMILMWSAYLINSIYAFFMWTKGAEKNEEK